MSKRRRILLGGASLMLVASGLFGGARLEARTNDFARYVSGLTARGIPVRAAALNTEASTAVADVVLPAEPGGIAVASSLPYQRMQVLRQATLAVKEGLGLDRVRIREVDGAGRLVYYLDVPVEATDLPDSPTRSLQNDASLRAGLDAALVGLAPAGASLAPVEVGPDADGTRQVVIRLVVKDLPLANTALPDFMWRARVVIDEKNQQGAAIGIVLVEADATDGTALLRYCRDVERREEQASVAEGVNPQATMSSPPVTPGTGG